MSIAEITQKITPVLEEYGVGYAGIFGSVARGEDLPESDVDIMVSVLKPIGIYKFMELQGELEHAIGRHVDLVSKNAVNKYLEPYINKDIITVYGKR
jgi:predicted nucleotidyltransferase